MGDRWTQGGEQHCWVPTNAVRAGFGEGPVNTGKGFNHHHQESQDAEIGARLRGHRMSKAPASQEGGQSRSR